jgi:hypothetical protein
MTNHIGIRIKHERVCVLYDETGRVLHIHRHSSANETLPQERVEEAARSAAANAPFRQKYPLPKTLHALHLAAADFDSKKRYGVDVKAKRLIEQKVDG